MPLLYKYRTFSTAQDKERVFSLIRDRAFWFSEAHKVNDPFEFRCAFNFASDLDDAAHLFAFVEHQLNPNTTLEETLSKARKVLARASRAKLIEMQWEASINLWKGFGQTASLCCFAGVPDSILMWSHYAGNHTGVCIEITHPQIDEVIYPVEYTDEVATVSGIDLLSLSFANLSKAIFLRKASCWSYEQEYRMICPWLGSRLQVFPPGSIKRVIVACAMPPAAHDELKRWLQLNAPDVILAYALPSSENQYALKVVNELDV
jgi:hypothetical protein